MSEINSVSIEDAFAITVTFLKEEQEKTKKLQAIIDDSEKIVNELKSISLGYNEGNKTFDEWYFAGDNDVREVLTDPNQYHKIKQAWNHQQEKIDKLRERLDKKTFNNKYTLAYDETVAEKINRLQVIIDDLAEGISFYGDTKNWTVSTNPVLFNIMETVDESHMWGKQISGKRARALQDKYPEVFKNDK